MLLLEPMLSFVIIVFRPALAYQLPQPEPPMALNSEPGGDICCLPTQTSLHSVPDSRLLGVRSVVLEACLVFDLTSDAAIALSRT